MHNSLKYYKFYFFGSNLSKFMNKKTSIERKFNDVKHNSKYK